MKVIFLSILLWLSDCDKEIVTDAKAVITSYSAKNAKVPIEPIPDQKMLMVPELFPIIPPIISPPPVTPIDRPLYNR